jgi:hypothetical protein
MVLLMRMKRAMKIGWIRVPTSWLLGVLALQEHFPTPEACLGSVDEHIPPLSYLLPRCKLFMASWPDAQPLGPLGTAVPSLTFSPVTMGLSPSTEREHLPLPVGREAHARSTFMVGMRAPLLVQTLLAYLRSKRRLRVFWPFGGMYTPCIA